MLGDEIVAQRVKRPDRGGCGKERIDLMFIDDFPASATVWVGRYPLEHDRCCAIGERSVDNIGVTSHPAHVSCTPEDLALTIIKNVFKGACRL